GVASVGGRQFAEVAGVGRPVEGDPAGWHPPPPNRASRTSRRSTVPGARRPVPGGRRPAPEKCYRSSRRFARARGGRWPTPDPGSRLALEVVDGRCGGVDAVAGEGPPDHAWFGLLDAPARCLLTAMLPSALRSEVALVGGAVGPGGGVVLVAVDGLGVAAGGVAGFCAGA